MLWNTNLYRFINLTCDWFIQYRFTYLTRSIWLATWTCNLLIEFEWVSHKNTLSLTSFTAVHKFHGLSHRISHLFPHTLTLFCASDRVSITFFIRYERVIIQTNRLPARNEVGDFGIITLCFQYARLTVWFLQVPTVDVESYTVWFSVIKPIVGTKVKFPSTTF